MKRFDINLVIKPHGYTIFDRWMLQSQPLPTYTRYRYSSFTNVKRLHFWDVQSNIINLCKK